MNANALRGVLLVTLAYALVGASFTANGLLGDYPYAGGQALRYGAACLLLLPMLGRGGLAPLRLLTAGQWVRIAVLAGVGMVGFNLAVLAAERTAEPAVPGVVVGCAPVVVAVLVPLLEGRRPAPVVLYGALLVAAGAFTVQGWGRTDLAGLGWSAVALAGEVGFTVLAVPVLRPLGPRLLTVAVCGVGAVEATLIGIVVDGAGFVRMPTGVEAGALLWQAVLATVVGFVLFYMAVQKIGMERATLYTGAIPVAAALSAAAVGEAVLGLPQAVGGLLVGAGAALGTGLLTRRRKRTSGTDAADTADAVDAGAGSAGGAAVEEDAGDQRGIVVHRHVAAARQPYEPGVREDPLGAGALAAQEQAVPGAPGDRDRKRGDVVPEEDGTSCGEGLVEAGGLAQGERLGGDRLG